MLHTPTPPRVMPGISMQSLFKEKNMSKLRLFKTLVLMSQIGLMPIVLFQLKEQGLFSQGFRASLGNIVTPLPQKTKQT